MTGRVVLVTGTAGYLGSCLAGQLAASPEVDRVVGIDAAVPDAAARDRMGAAEFSRVDIRNPLVSRVLDAAGVDTVVHAAASSEWDGTATRSTARSMAKELNVLGTMQLLAACQRSETVRHLIVRSTAGVYGASPRDPALFRELDPPVGAPAGDLARDAIDIEGYVRGFARRRPDVRVVMARMAEIVGPTVRTPFTRYLSLSPVVPVPFGRDPRLQLLHERDAVAVLRHLALGSSTGTVNVAGEGVITLNQAVRRAGRVPVGLPETGLTVLRTLAAVSGMGTSAMKQSRALVAGRVLDTRRLVTEVGFVPEHTTVEAFDDFARTLTPAVPPAVVRGLEVRVAALAGVRAEPVGAPAAEAAPPRETSRAASTAPTVSAATGRPRLVGIDGLARAPRGRRTR
jgi:UDP-glucose 4-epimerase